MAPMTRSSAPSTPAKARVGDSTTTPSTGTRRTPHCTKCHRPRAGHPRSGCPYIDASDVSPTSPSTGKSTSTAAQVTPPEADDGILEELSSLHIVSPTEAGERPSMPRTGKKLQRRLSVRFALVPEQTLASLSPTDSHLLEQLLQPGTISDSALSRDKVAHVLEWRKTLGGAGPSDAPKEESPEVKIEPSPNNTTTPLSRRMPCTLTTPTASLTATEPITDRGIGGSALNMNETIYLLPDPVIRRPTPLGRSMSFEQRTLFLQQLSGTSSMAPATLVSLSPTDLNNVRLDAEKIGFHVRVLPSREDDKKWVILGTEQEAIDMLAEKLLEEEKRSARAEDKGGRLTAVAGGVVFGAVATWTGLAFS